MHLCPRGHLNTLADYWQPLQRNVRYVQSMASANAAILEDMENRLPRNNVRVVGIPERAEGKNPLAFFEA